MARNAPDREVMFPPVTSTGLRGTLGQALIPVADAVRNIDTLLGLRNYAVRVVQSRWTGGYRYSGVEVVDSVMTILPNPKLEGLDALTRQPGAGGVLESGLVRVSEISGAYTEDDLLGTRDGGREPGEDVNVYWEIEFISPTGGPTMRRRFQPSSAPSYDAGNVQWSIVLTQVQQARDAEGAIVQ